MNRGSVLQSSNHSFNDCFISAAITLTLTFAVGDAAPMQTGDDNGAPTAVFFLYGSYLTLNITNASYSYPSPVLLSSTTLAPMTLFNQTVTVSLENASVKTTSNGAIQITLTEDDFKSLIAQLYVLYLPFTSFYVTFGAAATTIGVTYYYCLFTEKLLSFFNNTGFIS